MPSAIVRTSVHAATQQDHRVISPLSQAHPPSTGITGNTRLASARIYQQGLSRARKSAARWLRWGPAPAECVATGGGTVRARAGAWKE